MYTNLIICTFKLSGGKCPVPPFREKEQTYERTENCDRGCGPAGLTAGYRLVQEGYRPILLEKTSLIGGLSRTERYKGNHLDIGGHHFFTKSPEVKELWYSLFPIQGSPAKDDIALNHSVELVPGGPDPEHAEQVMLNRTRISRIFYRKHLFDYPLSPSFGTLLKLGVCNSIRIFFGYLPVQIRKREEHSLEDFYINRFGKPLYETFFRDYTKKLWGISPAEIAPDWGRQRVKGLSLWKALFSAVAGPFCRKKETSLIESFQYPKRGPGQYWEFMADEIRKRGGIIRLNAEITAVRSENGRITEVEYRENGVLRSETCDVFFSSIPVSELIAGMKDVPEEVRVPSCALPYRDFITVGLLLDRMNLRNDTARKTWNDIIPDCWIYIQEKEVRLGRLQIFNNWSPYLPADPEKQVWIGLEYFCSEGDSLWSMSDREFIDFAVGELEKTGFIRKEDVLDAVRIRVQKAYPAYFGSYAQWETIRAYLDRFDNLFCIGRNGQHRYNNMDHSMLTGLKAVEVMNGTAEKSDLWNINAEQTYHETDSSRTSL